MIFFTTKVGHYYWVLGGYFKNDWGEDLPYQEKTSIFSLRKMKWFDGPNLPEAILNTYVNNSIYCVTSLNQTTAARPLHRTRRPRPPQ